MSYSINPLKHKGLVFQIAKKVQSSYPTVELRDIVSEINLLIMKYSAPIKEGERRTTCYTPDMGKESTFITNFIGRKIMQQMKYSGLVDCKSAMNEGKQVYEYMNPLSMNTTVDTDDNDSIELLNSKCVSDSFDAMYENSSEEKSFDEILSYSKNLSEKEKVILSDYFLKNSTLEEIGLKLDISKERVRQIKEKALATLKCCSKIKELVE